MRVRLPTDIRTRLIKQNNSMIMNTIINLSSVAYNVILIATTIAMGIALSRIKIAGVSLGVTWILFVGIFAGSIGMTLDPAISLFIKEFGLILFIYSIGTQVGPAFFSSFKDGGLALNLLAVTLILLGSLTAYLIHLVTREDMSAMIGVLYGAVTNTPGLGAAQQTFSDLHEGVANPLYAQGYAVAYPLGVVGIILSIITIRKIFNIDFQEEQKVFDNNIRTGRLPKMKKKSVIFTGNSDITLEQLFSTFIGIAIGVFIGSLPISIPGMPVPVKLGLAGGPLIVSIIFSRYGYRLEMVTQTTTSANMLMRQMGICLFMAAVGIESGVGFLKTLVSGGYVWVLYGFIITFVPCILVGSIAKLLFHRSYFTIAGMISGAMTDPPALAYSNSICGNEQASVAYTTVYPLSMFLRVIIAQILVIISK